MKDQFGWTLSIIINPADILMIVLWIGDRQNVWFLKKPFKVDHDYFPQPEG
jgi:hypothetical protein